MNIYTCTYNQIRRNKCNSVKRNTRKRLSLLKTPRLTFKHENAVFFMSGLSYLHRVQFLLLFLLFLLLKVFSLEIALHPGNRRK